MKKFLIILVTGILWCTNIYAEFIELNKCFRSEAYGPANYENKEKAKRKTLIADSWDAWLVKYIYIGEYTAENCFSDEDLEGEYVVGYNCKWKKPLTNSQQNDPWYADNFKKINIYEDHIFSIDTNNGSVSTIKIKNDEWIKTMLDYWTLTIGAQTEKYKKKGLSDEVQKSKKNLEDTLSFHTEKYEDKHNYQITLIAGGVVRANRENRDSYWYFYTNSSGPQQFFGFIENDELIIDIKASRVEIKYEVYVPDKKVYKWGKLFGPRFSETGEIVTPDKSKFTVRTIFLCDKKYSDIAGETNIASGSAFFINKQGNLLTNNHVIDGCVQSKINYFKEEYDAKLVATDKNLDLALLKTELVPKSFISFSKSKLKKRDLITTAGYPLGIEFSDDLKINDGKISSLKGLDNNSNHIMHNIDINPGNSGGPIVNQKGELVAVAVSGMSKDIYEGLNFGIKSSAVENFLRSNKIHPTMGAVKFSMSSDDVNQLLEESTVYTFCELKN